MRTGTVHAESETRYAAVRARNAVVDGCSNAYIACYDCGIARQGPPFRFINVPYNPASALSPSLAGYMLAVSSFGLLLVVCGALKIGYDLALLKMFQAVRPPEEKREIP